MLNIFYLILLLKVKLIPKLHKFSNFKEVGLAEVVRSYQRSEKYQ